MATITLTKAQVEEIYLAMRHAGPTPLPYNSRVVIRADDAPPPALITVETPRERLHITTDGRLI
jgi:hypothetical protein